MRIQDMKDEQLAELLLANVDQLMPEEVRAFSSIQEQLQDDGLMPTGAQREWMESAAKRCGLKPPGAMARAVNGSARNSKIRRSANGDRVLAPGYDPWWMRPENHPLKPPGVKGWVMPSRW